MTFPRLYVIADAAVLVRKGVTLHAFASELRNAGVTLLQYRDKDAGPQTILRNAAAISEVFAGTNATLIMNDRADLAALAGWDGVHVGQEDLPPEDAKAVLAAARKPTHSETQELDAWGRRSLGRGVGVSTHNEVQLAAADAGMADYIAIGPVFATGTKLDAEPVVGLEGVRGARALTRKPLVAIGGITRENARSVVDAGADSIAVISGLFAPGEGVEKVARDFLEILR